MAAKALFTSLLVFFAIFARFLQASTAIAPLPEFVGALRNDDIDPSSATNGQSTLVVWTNAFSPYVSAHRVYGRLLGSNSGVNAFPIAGSGYGAHVATNGRDYLVAYSVGGSRFQTSPFDNVAVRIVDSSGSIGSEKFINRSRSGLAGAAVWTGDRWLVAFTSDGLARVCALDPQMEITTTTDIGAGSVSDLVAIGGMWWAIKREQGITEAVEILSDGSMRMRHSIQRESVRVVSTGERALVFIQSSASGAPVIEIASFDRATGFTPPHLLLADRSFRDAIAWQSGARLIHCDPLGQSLGATTVDSAGRVVESASLLQSASACARSTLGQSAEGLLLFISMQIEQQSRTTGIDLFAFRLTLAPLDPAARELISQADFSMQHTPLIASNGTNAVAFWSQTIDENERQAVFSRIIDADGSPAGPPMQLPFSLNFSDDSPTNVDIAFDGQRFILVWSNGITVQAAAIAADGRSAGEVEIVGTGSRPAVAAGAHGFFIVWKGANNMVRGTPLRSDASPAVPGGFEILPSLSGGQNAPTIASLGEDFLVLWSDGYSVESIVLSPAGTPRSLTRLADAGPENLFLGTQAFSGLAAWSSTNGSTLFAFGAAGQPFELFDPHWGNWIPRSIKPMAKGRYMVTLAREKVTYWSVITMERAFITGIMPLRSLGSIGLSKEGTAIVNDTPVFLFREGTRVYVSGIATFASRRRAVVH